MAFEVVPFPLVPATVDDLVAIFAGCQATQAVDAFGRADSWTPSRVRDLSRS